MDYKTLKNEQPVKQPYCSDTEANIKREKRKIKKKHVLLYIILIILFATSFLFFLNYLYHVYYVVKSDKMDAFHNVKVEIDFTKVRPTINIKFKSKKFNMFHYFVDESNVNKEKQRFESYSEFEKYYSVVNDKPKRQFKLTKERDVSLTITKVSNDTVDNDRKHDDHEHDKPHDDSVQCFQVDVSSLGRYHDSNPTIGCFKLSPNYWYGGHEAYDQPYWPINNQSFDYRPYITGYPDGWAGVLERYWLSSNGIAIFLNENIPLHVKHTDPNEICLMSDRTLAPYQFTSSVFSNNSLQYQLCIGPDPKTVHKYMLKNYIGTPKSFPDPRMITSPVWTTWAYYFTHINQSIVLDYAKQIAAHNYPRSNLEIDDKWEANYGDLDFYTENFPDMKTLSTQLHDLGFRVTLWVHPFCNIDSKCFIEGGDKGYWVKGANSDLPGLTSWWNGRYAALLDTTNPNATAYFVGKLNDLKKNYLVDAFKFDAGESAWAPQAFSFFDKTANPNVYSANYVRAAATTGNFIEVRVGARTQDVGIFYRLLDRATDWTIHDGIKSVITETLQFGILGYPYVLPDIIYGNSGPDKTKKELFIRWTQLNTFLPAMQFSVPPWYFDNETDAICQKLAIFREAALSTYLLHLASQLDGVPITRPMWWSNSTDEVVFTISDQFIVGDEIVVAPILDEGVRARDIYLPGGNWFDPSNNSTTKGPTWIKNYQAPLDKIPFFLLENGSVRNSNYFKSL